MKKPLIYAHRGNLDGPKPDRENNPDYIDEAINAGFRAEVDLHDINGHLFLGHDYPQYLISMNYLRDRSDVLLIHAKNFRALQRLNGQSCLHYFCHTSDPYTITSRDYLWIHDLSIETDSDDVILPLMTVGLIESVKQSRFNSICTDFVYYAQSKFCYHFDEFKHYEQSRTTG